MKRFVLTLLVVVFCCTTLSAQLTSAQKKAKTEIFNALKKIATNVTDYDAERISFNIGTTSFRVHISSKDTNPLYITIMLGFGGLDDYDTDIVRIAANEAASDMPVYVMNGDGYLLFDCEMYAVDAKPFIAVLPSMINALISSATNFKDAYEEAKAEYVPSSRSSQALGESYVSINNNDKNVFVFPKFDSTNDDNRLYLTKVTLGSQYTILDMTSYNGGEYQWCSISKNSYLSVNGTKYTLKKAEGIAYSPQHTDYPNYESGKDVSLSFKLYFPALPSGTTKFDFYEGTYDGWKINSIELKHGKSYNIRGEQIETNSHKWNCVAIEVQDNQTIITKVGTPKTNGTYMFSSQDQYIEDSDTGRKYYLITSSLGFEGSPTITYDTTPITFYEVYPALPYSVKRINIWSGSQYYVKNLEIR